MRIVRTLYRYRSFQIRGIQVNDRNVRIHSKARLPPICVMYYYFLTFVSIWTSVWGNDGAMTERARVLHANLFSLPPFGQRCARCAYLRATQLHIACAHLLPHERSLCGTLVPLSIRLWFAPSGGTSSLSLPFFPPNSFTRTTTTAMIWFAWFRSRCKPVLFVVRLIWNFPIPEVVKRIEADFYSRKLIGARSDTCRIFACSRCNLSDL